MHEFDLVIVGTGSGNSIPGPEFDDWNIAIIEKGVFGGTCLNVGCIPSKMFIYTADVALTVREAGRFNLGATLDTVDWPAIVERVFGRIDPIAEGGERYRTEECPNITVFRGEARFVDHRVLEVNGERVTGRHIVLGAGARPFIPPIPGIDRVDYHTSDTIMRLPELPPRLLILGGGYIANELGHVFDALGSQVTMVNRGPRLLRAEDDDISHRFTSVVSRRFDLRMGCEMRNAWQDDSGVHLLISHEGRDEVVSGDVMLVATGRTPNGDLLNLEATGVRHDRGRVIVDDCQRTNVEGIWAFGDLSNDFQLKHLANYEVRVLRHNLLHPEAMRHVDCSATPHAVFAHPQIASVGYTERAAAHARIPHVTAIQEYSGTAYGWAMEDTDGFVKVVADPGTRRLLGAHIMGAHAPSLIQQLIQGMVYGRTVDEMATGMMYIHPALSEVVENALLQF